VNPSELGWVLVLSGVLVALAGYFGWRQWQALRELPRRNLPPDERAFYRRQAYRRTFCSALMVVLAGLLVGTVFMESEYQDVTRQVSERNERGGGAPAEQEEKQFVRFFAGYWIGLLLVLFVLLALAAVDFWALTRFGLRQHRRLEADHRALLEKQLQELRHNRNGSG
jgi:hypothetical protein